MIIARDALSTSMCFALRADSLRKFIFAQIKNPRFSRNAGLVFGGAKRDRTADLNTASVALSQLSYSPKVLLGLRPEAGRIVCSRFGSVKENIPCSFPLLQANQVVKCWQQVWVLQLQLLHLDAHKSYPIPFACFCRSHLMH